jgi:hypothetical protein
MLSVLAVALITTHALARGSGRVGETDPFALIVWPGLILGLLAAMTVGAIQKMLKGRGLERETLERERLERERLEREKLEQEGLDRERLDRERLESERLERKLVQLRERIEQECPESIAASGLLRPEMLREMLHKRPTNTDQWFSRIPESLRARTDGKQFKRYAEEVFEIFAD